MLTQSFGHNGHGKTFLCGECNHPPQTLRLYGGHLSILNEAKHTLFQIEAFPSIKSDLGGEHLV